MFSRKNKKPLKFDVFLTAMKLFNTGILKCKSIREGQAVLVAEDGYSKI